MFKIRKVFDCQSMPDDVRDAFFRITCANNDCFVNHWIAECPEDYENSPENLLVDNWLKQFNLSPSEASGDDPLLISHWW